MAAAERDGLVFAFVLDGQGGGRTLDWDGIAAWRPADGTLWVHVNTDGVRASDWVREKSGGRYSSIKSRPIRLAPMIPTDSIPAGSSQAPSVTVGRS